MKLFQKKPLYIVLIVVFTLILIADLVLRFAVSGRSSRPEGFSMPEVWSASEGFDPNNLPEGFDSSSMPEGFQPGSRPEGFDPSNMPEGFDPSQRPGSSGGSSEASDSSGNSSQRPRGGPSFGNMPGGGNFRQKRGFLSTVRKLWIPIGVVCLLVDALSVFMLIRIRRKEKRSAGTAVSGDAAEDDCGG